MNNYRVKFALFISFLATINAINLINILVNVVVNGGFIWVFNGVAAVIIAFAHAILIDDVLNDY